VERGDELRHAREPLCPVAGQAAHDGSRHVVGDVPGHLAQGRMCRGQMHDENPGPR
jgi:hypothetical protein